MTYARAVPNPSPAAAQSHGIVGSLLSRLLVIYGVAALLWLVLVPLWFSPAEDAVILFHYSRNLAQTGVISFLAGGPRVEGATDFGWMLMLAGVTRLGISPFAFCGLVNVGSLLGLAIVLLRLSGSPASPRNVLAVVGAAAGFRQIFAAASGFAVLPDALLLSVTVLCVVRGWPVRAALASLGLCLFRPDGVVFAVPLLILMGLRQRHAFRATLLYFVLPGAAYFLWRWHYFGELFPLPFVVKETFHRDLLVFIFGSMRASLVWLLFAAAVLVPALWRRWNRANAGLLLALLVVPTLFYWTVRMDQNVAARFFFYVPLAVGLLLAIEWRQPGFKPVLAVRALCAAWAVLLALPLYREWLTFRYMQFDNTRAIATSLGYFTRPGTLLVSEAGVLPFYSGWKTWDAWGLNTPEFAHRFIQPADVQRLAPDLVVLHPDLNDHCVPQPGWEPAGYRDRAWPNMVKNLVLGADGRYELWLTSYGSEYYRRRKGWHFGEGDRECWFVRKDSPLRPAIERVLLAHHGVAPSDALRLEAQHDPRLH